MMWITRVTMILAVLAICAAGEAQVAVKRELTLQGARQVIAAAAAEARRDTAGGTIAIVDEGGNLLALERIDGTFAASANISIGKARTAAIFKKPTKAFEETIKGGRAAMIALNDFTPLQGGVPIVVDGQVIGAIGVSGAASAQRDEEIAVAGVTAAKAFGAKAAAASPAATYIESQKVAAAFAKGVPLLEVDGYKIHASRREGGNLYVSGPGGLWIISPEAKPLGMIKTTELPANIAWGDADGRTLYMTARSSLSRIRLAIPGIRP